MIESDFQARNTGVWSIPRPVRACLAAELTGRFLISPEGHREHRENHLGDLIVSVVIFFLTRFPQLPLLRFHRDGLRTLNRPHANVSLVRIQLREYGP